jgi:hypothetical protein
MDPKHDSNSTGQALSPKATSMVSYTHCSETWALKDLDSLLLWLFQWHQYSCSLGLHAALGGFPGKTRHNAGYPIFLGSHWLHPHVSVSIPLSVTPVGSSDSPLNSFLASEAFLWSLTGSHHNPMTLILQSCRWAPRWHHESVPRAHAVPGTLYLLSASQVVLGNNPKRLL